MGIYADVQWEGKQSRDLVQVGGKETDREKFKEMVLEYKRFKKGEMKHFRFSTTGTVFGISHSFNVKYFF